MTLTVCRGACSHIGPGSLGVLGGSESATAAFQLPALALPSLIGFTLHHAGAVLAPTGASVSFVTIPVAVKLLH